MGITGLWPIVEPTSIPTTLEALEGKKLAVDVSLWIYQAQMGIGSDSRCPHLELLVNRMCKLLFYKIRPVFVFDGANVPVFKYRVLDSRRMKKLAEEIGVNPAQKKHLKEIAAGNQTEAELEASVNKLISPSKKRRRRDDGADELFEAPLTCAAADVFELMSSSDELESDVDSASDVDFDVIEMVKAESLADVGGLKSTLDSNDIRSVRNKIDDLVDQRERIRKSRLHPSKIPTDSHDFSNFQLRRLLSRGRLNNEIDNLAKSTFGTESSVKVAVRGPHGEQHVLKYAEDDEIAEVKNEGSKNVRPLPGGFELSLPHLQPQVSRFEEEGGGGATLEGKEELKDALRTFNNEDFGGQVGGYLSKSGMIEALTRKRSGIIEQAKVQEDGWSSDELIDVSDTEDVEALLFGLGSTAKTTSVGRHNDDGKEEAKNEDPEVEWDPQRYEKASTSAEEPRDSWKTVAEAAGYERDPGVYKDLQDFLTACGFPWIEAPGEAEAQCVELERLGLVEGVVSDDSDVWAFGVRTVFRHLFSRSKNVQRYDFARTKTTLGLDQEDYVALAMVSGGDYSPGLRQIGVVTALEIIAEMSVKRETHDDEDVQSRVFELMKTINAWTKQTTTKAELRNAFKAFKANNEDDAAEILVNRDVVRAYFEPLVDDSSEPLRWRQVDVARVRQLLAQQLGWQGAKFEKQVLVPLNRWNDFVGHRASYQKHITSYTHRIAQSEEEQRTRLTKRTWNALKRLADNTGNSWAAETWMDKVEASNAQPSQSLIDGGSMQLETAPVTSPSKKGRQIRNRKGKRTTTQKKKTITQVAKTAANKATLNLSESSGSEFDD